MMFERDCIVMDDPGPAIGLEREGIISWFRKAMEDEMTEVESLKDEIERLRSLLRQCVRGPDGVEISPGEVLGLHLAHKGESFVDIRDKIRAGTAA